MGRKNQRGQSTSDEDHRGVQVVEAEKEKPRSRMRISFAGVSLEGPVQIILAILHLLTIALTWFYWPELRSRFMGPPVSVNQQLCREGSPSGCIAFQAELREQLTAMQAAGPEASVSQVEMTRLHRIISYLGRRADTLIEIQDCENRGEDCENARQLLERIDDEALQNLGFEL